VNGPTPVVRARRRLLLGGPEEGEAVIRSLEAAQERYQE